MTRLIVFLVLLIFPGSAFAQTNTPVPSTPTPVDFPSQQVIEALATQNANLYQVPDVPLLPENRSGEIFGYAKWIVSQNAAEEVFGVFHPIFTAIGVLLVIEVTLNAIYVIIWIVAQIVRWVVWLIKIVLQIIQSLAAAGDTLLGWLFKFRRIF